VINSCFLRWVDRRFGVVFDRALRAVLIAPLLLRRVVRRGFAAPVRSAATSCFLRRVVVGLCPFVDALLVATNGGVIPSSNNIVAITTTLAFFLRARFGFAPLFVALATTTSFFAALLRFNFDSVVVTSRAGVRLRRGREPFADAATASLFGQRFARGFSVASARVSLRSLATGSRGRRFGVSATSWAWPVMAG
jgi:hypothetical protein